MIFYFLYFLVFLCHDEFIWNTHINSPLNTIQYNIHTIYHSIIMWRSIFFRLLHKLGFLTKQFDTVADLCCATDESLLRNLIGK